jgi:hypothetical protein
LYEEREEEEDNLFITLTMYQVWRFYTARFHVKIITDFEWIKILKFVAMAYIKVSYLARAT